MAADKTIMLLGLAMKAGKVISGETGCENSIRDGSAFLVILAEDGGQMGDAGGSGIGIIPFKGPGRHPHADGQFIARNADFLRRIGHIGGRAVKQQRSAFHADTAPLRSHTVGVGGSQVLILNVCILQVSACVLNGRAFPFIKGKVQH